MVYQYAFIFTFTNDKEQRKPINKVNKEINKDNLN